MTENKITYGAGDGDEIATLLVGRKIVHAEMGSCIPPGRPDSSGLMFPTRVGWCSTTAPSCT